MNTFHADPSALNIFFNKTAERLVGQNATTDDDILSHIDSLASSHDSFKLQKVTLTYSSLSNHYEMIVQLDTTTSQFLLSNRQPNTSPHLHHS